MVPFIVVEEESAMGVSVEGSMIWGAGVSGDDVGLDSGRAAAGSCGNATRAFGGSLRMTVFDLVGLADIFAME